MGGCFDQDLERSSRLGTGCKSTSKGRCPTVNDGTLISEGLRKWIRTMQIPSQVIRPAIDVMFWNQPKTEKC